MISFKHSSRLWLALLLPAVTLWGACKRTKYTCPAYTSAFVLDMPAYKRSAAQDSMSASADTSLDVDVIAVLAERIRKDPPLRYEYDADSVPKFPESSVIKTNVLLIKRISRRRKDKMMASVPMISIFPVSPDSLRPNEEAPGLIEDATIKKDEESETPTDEKPEDANKDGEAKPD
jgi:hypothetical protein